MKLRELPDVLHDLPRQRDALGGAVAESAQGPPIQGPFDTSHKVTEQMAIQREHNKWSDEWVLQVSKV